MWFIYLAAYIVALDILTFLTFRADKRRAESGAWRIPERTLLLLAFCGGWFGAKRAQRHCLHKTRKQPFGFLLNAVPVVWCTVVVLLVYQQDIAQQITSGMDWVASAQTNERETPRFFKRASH